VLNESELCLRDGNCTRREIIARFLLLNAVLDQGSDMEGVRQLLADTLNQLYAREIRILHKPIQFFQELGFAIDKIDEVHEIVRKLREPGWRERNKTRKRYNLFMDGTTQTLNYAVFRWGVPLSVPLALSQNMPDSSELLLDFLENEDNDWPCSSEMMSQKLKDHPKYGLGKAIGDKAAHLFAKWMVYTFPVAKKRDTPSWGPYSFEVPFDSNAGRVLLRSGFLFHFASEQDYVKNEVIQRGQGKGGADYVRVTNIRGMAPTVNTDEINMNAYKKLCVECLRTHKKAPSKIEIQRIPAALLYQSGRYTVGQLDDGLMFIGTTFCANIEKPSCDACPLCAVCEAHNRHPEWIEKYRT
jgi:hypothetical protein